ncbi:MAG: YbaB/EbfC family nucleoid-associated protein [Myxococcales bacterium]|nr:YbaB/EbfC family nucleoid-associated protein [Myxococcota bacterium]MDW8283330.1 YbaB/EbfC family nucleoid-associated protein [Myxococcales bacterium]
MSDPPFPGMPDLGALMQQAQRMQAELQRTQAELQRKQVEASAGGGMVTAVVTGSRELVSLRIDPQVIDPKDPQLLQDLIIAAVNQGLQRAQALAEEEMRRTAAGLGLPLGLL